jgi:hypothetical protein
MPINDATKENEEKVKNYLIYEEAKAKAMYPYKEDSIEPIVDGAWKGAVAFGVPKTIHENFKGGRISGKKALLYYGTGGVGGGLVGYFNNKRKVDSAREARRFLMTNNPNSKFVKKDSDIKKTASYATDKVNDFITEPSRQIQQKPEEKHYVKDTITGAGVGAALGGALGLFGGIKSGSGGIIKAIKAGKFAKAPLTRGVISGGVIGGVQAGTGDAIDEEAEEKKMSLPTQMAISMGASAAIEPIVNRGLGRAFAGKKIDKILSDEKESTIKANNAYKKKGTFGKILHLLTPNIASKYKDGYDSDFVDMLKGSKKQYFDKQLLGHTAGKALWGSILGYGLGKGLEKLTQNSSSQQKS